MICFIIIAADRIINHRHKDEILRKRKDLYEIKKRAGRRKISQAARAELEAMIAQEINNERP